MKKSPPKAGFNQLVRAKRWSASLLPDQLLVRLISLSSCGAETVGADCWLRGA